MSDDDDDDYDGNVLRGVRVCVEAAGLAPGFLGAEKTKVSLARRVGQGGRWFPPRRPRRWSMPPSPGEAPEGHKQSRSGGKESGKLCVGVSGGDGWKLSMGHPG